MKINIKKSSIGQITEHPSFQQADKNYFHRSEWLAIYGNAIEVIGIFDEGGNLIGYFFLYNGITLGQRFGITAPYTQHIGLTFAYETTNPANINSLLKNLHTEIANYILGKNLLMFNLVFPIDHFDAQPYLWKDCEASLKYTYQLDLSQSVDSIIGNYSSERRKNITKAKKDGLSCQVSYNFPLLYEMTHKTLSTKKADSNTEIVKSIFFDYATDKNAFGCITYRNNQPSAMVFCLIDNSAVHYLFGYTDNENSHEGASALAMQTAIEHSKKLGVPLFDFCGSMLPSVERYFRGFGAQLVPMMQIVRASKKGKLLLRLRKRKVTK
jgi:hypothetical protein